MKQKCPDVQLQSEDVYMATTFQDFIQMLVRKLRGEDQEEELLIDYVSVLTDGGGGPLIVCDAPVSLLLLLFYSQVTKDVNNMTVKMPNQCFINGRFEDAESGKTYNTINPTDGAVSGGGGVRVCVCVSDCCVAVAR